LSYENAEAKLHASNLNIQLLATRYGLPIQPGLIIDQTPQAGEEVDYGYPVGALPLLKRIPMVLVRNGKTITPTAHQAGFGTDWRRRKD
jgi:PASTA domain-containing protein